MAALMLALGALILLALPVLADDCTALMKSCSSCESMETTEELLLAGLVGSALLVVSAADEGTALVAATAEAAIFAEEMSFVA